jgi:ABC-type phosphate transport system substrate-binding protein
MEKNTKGIKVFLQDAKAISPAIATLILIVIAAVAAAGIGIIVQKAQTNTQGQVGSQHLDVSGTITIKGSTTILPIEQNEVQAFNKLYPSVTVSIGGGGSSTGRALVFTKQVDIGASSDIWPTTSGSPGGLNDNNPGATGITYDGRELAVIQGAGPNAFVYETKIGKGMVVLAGHLVDGSGSAVKGINIVPGTTSSYTSGILNISFQDLRNAYINTTDGILNTTVPGINTFNNNITLVQRSDAGGTSENFNQWLNGAKYGQMDGTGDGGYKSAAIGAQGNQGIRDYVQANVNSLGYMDIGFAAGGANNNGASLVLAATMNGTAANKATSGAGGLYDQANYGSGKGKAAAGSSLGLPVSNVASKSLSRDLYFYSQPGAPSGAVQAFLDFVTGPDGQTIVDNSGFFKN